MDDFIDLSDDQWERLERGEHIPSPTCVSSAGAADNPAANPAGDRGGDCGRPMDPRLALELEDEREDVEARLQKIQEEVEALLEEQEQLIKRREEINCRLEASAAAAAAWTAANNADASNGAINENAGGTNAGGSGSGAKADLGVSVGVRGAGGGEGGAGLETQARWQAPFEWDGQVAAIGRDVFGIGRFRSQQREIVNAVLCKRDVFVIMPAGGGKSLCYQLPALLSPGISLVVSPLLSLIHDQVMCLSGFGVPAAMLTSTTSKEEEKEIYATLEFGELGGSCGGGRGRGKGRGRGGGKGGSVGRGRGKGETGKLDKGKGKGRGGGRRGGSGKGKRKRGSESEEEEEEEDESEDEQWGKGEAEEANGRGVEAGLAQAPGAGAGLKLLYVTPEKVARSKRFMSKLEKCHAAGRLSLIAIDEAHCCSQWGHDFRPDYAHLSVLKKQFPKTPMLALTATATERVRDDVRDMLQMRRCELFVSSVNRPNLFYEVREKPANAAAAVDAIARFILDHYAPSDSGIVYCFSRKECEQVASDLSLRGIPAAHYHADMDPTHRTHVHVSWSRGEIQVIVGTVAFGMGINKPDVRFVIHHTLSKSIETYYQESGRAGRDGLPARCILFFRCADLPRQSSMVFPENAGLINLYAMGRYAMNRRECRRTAIFKHFGEEPRECEGMCDICSGGGANSSHDFTPHARSILEFVQATQSSKERSLTLLQLTDQWRAGGRGGGGGGGGGRGGGGGGEEEEGGRGGGGGGGGGRGGKAGGRGSGKGGGMGEEESWGSLVKFISKETTEQLVTHMLLSSVLREEFQHSPYATNAYLLPGRNAHRVLSGQMRVTMDVPKQATSATPSAAAAATAANATAIAHSNLPSTATATTAATNTTSAATAASDAQLSRRLDQLRRSIASQHGGLFPHAVLSSHHLSALSQSKPATVPQLIDVIGQRRADQFGDQILAIIVEHVEHTRWAKSDEDSPEGTDAAQAEGARRHSGAECNGETEAAVGAMHDAREVGDKNKLSFEGNEVSKAGKRAAGRVLPRTLSRGR
ncbi:hypothetical protein CLOM_g9659 [Closterium sp. NIES-68]|nr:hypothetical protein CLOM_g9659 [Closterium sp. NIES-68]